jgi:hypothetical protein
MLWDSPLDFRLGTIEIVIEDLSKASHKVYVTD